jgi:RND family efflux transporter MFP subunit
MMTADNASDYGSWTIEACPPPVADVPQTSEAENELVDAPVSQIVLDAIAGLQRCSDLSDACRMLANQLQRWLECRQVVVGVCARPGLNCRVKGISGIARFDLRSRLLRLTQEALNEATACNSEIVWRAVERQGAHSLQAHARLAQELRAEQLATIPLGGPDGQVHVVLLIVDTPAESGLGLVRDCGPALGSCLQLVGRSERGIVARCESRLRSFFFQRRSLMFAVVGAGLAALMAMPWPYRIECRCQVQPLKRRYVVAPYDGTLDQTLVAPGDVVHEGDVLARMDEQEIRWELAGAKADWSRAKKEREAAMATHRTSEAQLARLEMERLQLQMELLENRIQHLAIKSPINGIVVTGDLEKAEGAPLTIGQTLFEVAPLDKMVVEVDVPEDEISHVHPDMPVTVQLDAFPDQSYDDSVRRIHPRAELKDHESVFVTELVVDNADGLLRPGMNGQAQIHGDQQRVAWILFHKPWKRIRQWLGW